MTTDFEDPLHKQRASLSGLKVLLEQFRSTLQSNSAILPYIDNAITELEAAIEEVNTQLDEAEKNFFDQLENEHKQSPNLLGRFFNLFRRN